MTESRRNRGPHLSLPGLVPILIGLALLLRNLGILPPDILSSMWRLWPLLVIAWGIQIMTGRGGMRLTAVTLVLLLLVAAGALFLVAPWQGDGPGQALRREYTELLQGLAQAEVVLDFAAGTLHLGSLPSASPELSHLAVHGESPQVDFSRRGPTDAGTGRLVISRSPMPRNILIAAHPTARWNLDLSPNLPLALNVTASASQSRLDMRDLNVHELDLTLNASHSELYLPEREGVTEIEIYANASNVNIIVPHGVAVTMTIMSQASSVRVDGNWERKGEVYTSPDYNEWERQIELYVTANVSRVRVVTGSAHRSAKQRLLTGWGP